MRRARTIIWRSALIIGVGLVALFFYLTYLPSPPGNLTSAQRQRYAEVRDMIRRNLHFSAHFTWATNAETIVKVRPRIEERDIPVLIALLEDKQRAVAYGAEGLLATLGDDAVPALRLASASRDSRVSLTAKSALSTIERCRNQASGMRRDICPAEKPPKR